MAEPWPTPTPRHELLARVATTGRRRIIVRRLAAAVAAASVATSAAVGLGVGRSGGIDLVAESISLEGAADAVAPFSACPGSAPIGELHRDDRVFLTGRDEGAAWLELRSPSDATDRVWVPAAVVGADGDVADLPVHSCTTEGDQLALPGQTTTTLPPTTIPGETTTTSTTAPGETTTTAAPGTTTTSTTPTTQADSTSPTISQLQRSVAFVYENSTDCPGPFTLALSARVADASPVTVTLQWRVPQAAWSAPVAMNDPDADGRFSATIGPFPYATVPINANQTMEWRVTAVDNRGNPPTTVAATANQLFTIRSAGNCLI